MSTDYFSASPTSFREPIQLSSSASSTPYLSPYASRSNRSSSILSDTEGDGDSSIQFRSDHRGEGDETDDEGDVAMGDVSVVDGTPAHRNHASSYGLGLGLGRKLAAAGSIDMDAEEEEVNRSFESAMSVFNSPFSMRGSPVGNGVTSDEDHMRDGKTAHLLSARRNGQLAAFDSAPSRVMAGSPMRSKGAALFGSSSAKIKRQHGANTPANAANQVQPWTSGESEGSAFAAALHAPSICEASGREPSSRGVPLEHSLGAPSMETHGFTLGLVQSREAENVFNRAPVASAKPGSSVNSAVGPTKMTSSGHGFGARQRAFGRESSRANIGVKSAGPSGGSLGFGAMATFQITKPGGSASMSRDPSRSSMMSNASTASSSSGLMLPPPNPLRRKSQDRSLLELEGEQATEDMFGQSVSRLNGSGLGKPTKKPRTALPPTCYNDRTLGGSDVDRTGASSPNAKSQGPKGNGNMLFRPSPRRADSMPSPGADTGGSPLRRNNKSFVGDLMDIDSPYRTSLQPPARSTSTPKATQPLRMTPSGSPDLGDFFCDSPSSNAGKVGAFSKMQSATPAAAESSPESGVDSPSSLRPGPVSRLMEKSMSTNAPGLFGSGRPGGLVSSRRTQPYKRPFLAPLAPTGETSMRPSSTASALPVLQSGVNTFGGGNGLFKVPSVPRPPPTMMRRAVSVCDQSASGSAACGAPENQDENRLPPTIGGQRAVSHFEVGPGAEYHQPIQHVGGRITPDDAFASGHGGGKKMSPNSQDGFLGFGENEMEGKILPCHRVKEDGLVRISHETLRSLINGEYEDRMQRYHIIDCRFDYEYAGGHVDGAVNVNSTTAVEELLLKIGQGVYYRGGELPQPSRSGEELSEKPIVLVFHCEFSNKRAPAFAKHLRSRDRTLNNYAYPKVYYPELYILEGGYCGFYGQCPDKCEPMGYVPMDDPKHFDRRDSDLHDFRKFTRTRSFTYGEQQPAASARSQPPPVFGVGQGLGGIGNSMRMSAPQGLAAPRLAIPEEEDSPAPQIRMGKGRLSQLSRSTNDSGADTDEDPSGMDSHGPNDSPCARPAMNSGLAPGIFGSTKSRVMGRPRLAGSRGAFSRVASYAGTTSAGVSGPSAV